MNSNEVAAKVTDNWRRAKNNGKIPRSPNSFMLFGMQMRMLFAGAAPNLGQRLYSKIIGMAWNSMSDQEKGPWKRLEREMKGKHQQMFPEQKPDCRNSTLAESSIR